MNILDDILQQALARPGHPAVIEGGESGEVVRVIEYRAVAEAISRGKNLRTVRPGDRCGLVAAQGAEFILHGLAIMASGACLFPISEQVTGATLESLIQRVKLHHVVRDGAWETMTGVGDVDGQGDRAFRALDPAYIRFTSGTTHTNKGVILGHGAVVERIKAANRGLGIGPADRILWLLPMAHHWVVSILLYMAQGATVLVPKGGAGAALALADTRRATVMYASPQDYSLLAEASSQPMKVRPRLAVSTASGLTPALAARVRERLGLSLTQALGMIEVGLPAMNGAHSDTKPLSVGRAFPDYRIWLRDEQGELIPGNGLEQVGEIMIEGPGFYGAYMDPWRPAASGAFATGDQGYFDADGDLFLVGRRKNRMITGGMKFFCEEVEQAVEFHPKVVACRVLPRADALLGEVPIVEVELRPGAGDLSAAELGCFLRGNLPPHMIPVEVLAVVSIPRTATGKIQRW